jgi:hypothetical protein
MRRRPQPGHAPGEAEPVQQLRLVAGDTQRQHIALPGARRQAEARQLLDHAIQPLVAGLLVRRADVLVLQEEAHQHRGRDWLDLTPQLVQHRAVDARQQPPLAPLELGRLRAVAAAEHEALRLQQHQR